MRFFSDCYDAEANGQNTPCIIHVPRLSSHLRSYIHKNIKKEPQLFVVLSDSDDSDTCAQPACPKWPNLDTSILDNGIKVLPQVDCTCASFGQKSGAFASVADYLPFACMPVKSTKSNNHRTTLSNPSSIKPELIYQPSSRIPAEFEQFPFRLSLSICIPASGSERYLSVPLDNTNKQYDYSSNTINALYNGFFRSHFGSTRATIPNITPRWHGKNHYKSKT